MARTTKQDQKVLQLKYKKATAFHHQRQAVALVLTNKEKPAEMFLHEKGEMANGKNYIVVEIRY